MLPDISESVSGELCRNFFPNYTSISNDTNDLCCGYSNDTITYWHPTRANSFAINQCPERILGLEYNVKENASRFCNQYGIWNNISDYNRCIIKLQNYNVMIIWFAGYTISMIALWIALVILKYFRSLKCIRNEIHCNLIISYIIRVLMWYLNMLPQLFTTDWSLVMANIATALHLFSQTANYYWMFVEGLYLFTIIVWTYGLERYTIWHYSIIGWGIPFLLATTAILAIIFTTDHSTPWLEKNKTVEKIKLIVIHIPITVSIIINVFVMAFIMHTLVIKMKQTKPPVRRNSSKFTIFSLEYKKAIKATVVLIPLLGIAHFLIMFKPKIIKYLPIYQIISGLMISTQGFFVALIYCFLNREVRFVIKAKYHSFRGFLPNTSRMRQTTDDFNGPVRRSNSILKTGNSEDFPKVFQCRIHRTTISNSNNSIENIPIVKDPLVVTCNFE